MRVLRPQSPLAPINKKRCQPIQQLSAISRRNVSQAQKPVFYNVKERVETVDVTQEIWDINLMAVSFDERAALKPMFSKPDWSDTYGGAPLSSVLERLETERQARGDWGCAERPFSPASKQRRPRVSGK